MQYNMDRICNLALSSLWRSQISILYTLIMDKSRQFEYEERAFLSKADFSRVKDYLDRNSLDSEIDNKQSYFFVLSDVNVSIAASSDNVKVKYKGGQLGRGNGFEEIEFAINRDSLDDSIKLFTSLLKKSPQESYQFRINYSLGNGINVALKYTETWGFHLEAERVYEADKDSIDSERAYSAQQLDKLAELLGIIYITDDEMLEFKKRCEAGRARGEYKSIEFRKRYGHLFGLS